MRIVFSGDIHGSVTQLRFVFKTAQAHQCDLVWACGDFGFWPHTAHGVKFLEAVDALVEETGIKLFWTDGNHENHDELDRLRWVHGEECPIATSVGSWWVPRGCVVALDGVDFMSYGGGYSVDWKRRVKGKSWWPQELVDEGHVREVPDVPVDVLVTHDTPFGEGVLSYKDSIPESLDQRRILSELVDRVQPRLVFSGHHHVRSTFRTVTPKGWQATVRVLGRDGMGRDSVYVFDTEHLFRDSADLELTLGE